MGLKSFFTAESSSIKDEHRVVLYSVVACTLIWTANALVDRYVFLKSSFWDAFVFDITDFENVYRIVTLFIFVSYGIVASKIVRKRRQWGEDLLKSKKKIQALLSAIPDSLFRIRSDGTLLESVSESDEPPGGITDNMVGKKIDDLLPLDTARTFMDTIELSRETKTIQMFEFQLERDGETAYFEARVIKTVDDEALAIIRDISDRKILENKLRSLSFTDDLTGLNNRRGFFHLAGQMMKLASRNGCEMLLFYLDIDDMKSINDTFGHQVGDSALIATGSMLGDTFRKSDIVARIGGDEFAVLLMDVKGGDVEALVAHRIEKKIKDLNASGNLQYELSLSVGMARFNPRSPCVIDELLSRADASMYRNKKRTKERAV